MEDIEFDMEEDYKYDNAKIYLALGEIDTETEQYVLFILFTTNDYSYCIKLAYSKDDDVIKDKIDLIDDYLDDLDKDNINYETMKMIIDKIKDK